MPSARLEHEHDPTGGRRPRARWVASAVLTLIVVAGGCSGGTSRSASNHPVNSSARTTRPAAPTLPSTTTGPTTAAPTTTIPPTSAVPSCPPLQTYQDGNAGPLFCSDGSPSPAAVAYFRAVDPSLFALPSGAAPDQIRAALCADTQSTNPIAGSALQLASVTNHFTVPGDPLDFAVSARNSC